MAENSRLRAAIIIVSETASKDASTDKGIPALQATFAESGGDQWLAEDTQIVSDNVQEIQRAITQRTDGSDPANLIVTSGGTGFAQKDVTPEVGFTDCSSYAASEVDNHVGRCSSDT
jgi:gephyrin